MTLPCALAFIALYANAGPAFRDVTAEVGLDFAHDNGFSPERRLVETMGGGGALFDMDRDGDLDLYLVQGNSLPDGDPSVTNRLYRNDSGVFTDVTHGSGADDASYGLGCVAADYDGDGLIDLYVTNLGPNRLFRNMGDGRFEDATEKAGVGGGDRLSASAAFADYDRDGDLDLYVCNYVDYSVESDIPCYYEAMRIYCGPDDYQGVPDTLYRNNGNGAFTDATRTAGAFSPNTKGLGVIFTDVDNDGWLDIYVANDMTPNLLYINQRNGSFSEEGVLRGVAFNGDGIENGSMGVDSGDFDNDGDLDLWVTNFSLEANTLMVNDEGYFFDATFNVGLAEPSFYALGFGSRFVDADNDGSLDLLVGNGHIWDNVDKIDAKMSYAMPMQYYRNVGGSFVDATEDAGLEGAMYVARGMLVGDLDNDGDHDVALCQSNGPTVVLRNDIGSANNWLMVELIGPRGNVDAIGARVEAVADGRPQLREVLNGASYLAGNDMRPLFGLSDATRVERLTVRWPDGSTKTLTDIAPNQRIRIEYGDGEVQ